MEINTIENYLKTMNLLRFTMFKARYYFVRIRSVADMYLVVLFIKLNTCDYLPQART